MLQDHLLVQGIEAATRVQRVNNLAKRSPSNAVTFNSTHEYNLSSPYSQNALSMDQARVTEIVKTTFAEDLGLAHIYTSKQFGLIFLMG